jgi:hypothetical protein
MARKPEGTIQRKAKPDDVDRLLIELATAILADYFFDPDNEAEYKERYPARRSPPSNDPGPLRGDPPLAVDTLEGEEGDLDWQLDVLTNRNGFRLTMSHPSFSATIEGIWQFQRENLRNPLVIQRDGTRKAISEAVEDLLDEMDGDGPTEEELEDLMAVLSEIGDSPLTGDNPDEPPEATWEERQRLRALLTQRVRRTKQDMRPEDRAWLEMTPQLLPAMTDLAIEAMNAQVRSENRVAMSLQMLSWQLEIVRYRQDRGWDWAKRMLSDYQQRLISLGKAGRLDQRDWFALAAVLTEAKVPVSDDMQSALVEAGMNIPDPGPPEEMLSELRGLSDEMAGMVDSPFDVIEALSSAGAVMPASLRSFMATEMALSPHAVLREAVPLMLLDADAGVRRSAGAAMEQIAGAGTVSPDWLRRAITLRNWIPQPDRGELDRAIRKARSAGVEIGAWPALAAAGQPSAIVFHASMLDGSGAQSIIALTKSGKKGLVAGLLLKHGIGVADAWFDQDVPRRTLNAMVQDLKTAVPSDEVDRSYVDTAVQHAIATGIAKGTTPNEKLLRIAECVGGAEWKDRGLDVTARSAELFESLDPALRTQAAIRSAQRRMADWMARVSVADSWFEDHQDVRRVIAKVPRRDNAAARQVVLTEILPGYRAAWAERFLLTALWCQSAMSATHRGWANDFVVLAHAVAGETSLEDIPVMVAIADQTVIAARTGAW